MATICSAFEIHFLLKSGVCVYTVAHWQNTSEETKNERMCARFAYRNPAKGFLWVVSQATG
jgi:hypothetical protein